MKNFFFDLFPYAYIRTPLLPVKTRFTERELIELFKSDITQIAIFLASKTLYKKLGHTSNDVFFSKEVLASLLKYAIRMHNRCTPFGIFAGNSIVPLEHIAKTLRKTCTTLRVSPDLEYVESSLKDAIEKGGESFSTLLIEPNQTIYKVGRKRRYIEIDGTSKNEYRISSFVSSDFIDYVLKISRNGISRYELIKKISSYDDTLRSIDIDKFIDKMLHENILVLKYYDKRSVSDTVEALFSSQGSVENYILPKHGDLTRIKHLISKKKPFNIDELSRLLFTRGSSNLNLNSIPLNVVSYDDYDEACQLGIDDEETEKFSCVKQAISLLNRISQYDPNIKWRRFINEFVLRYGEREIPILQALDPELGIKYEIESGLHRGGDMQRVEDVLIKKIDEAHLRNKDTIYLNSDDFKWLTENWDDMPMTMAVNLRIIVSDDRKTYFLEGIGGTSALNIIGRFSYQDKFAKVAAQIADFEDKMLEEHEVIAQILYIPSNKLSNVLAHPNFRKYEIPILTTSLSDRSKILELEDLVISVRNNKVVLRSKKLNKYVLPRIDNAHNYNMLKFPVYQFLCDYQGFGLRTSLNFDWGEYIPRFVKRLPRVQFGENVILKPAEWMLKREDFDILFNREEGSFLERVENWRSRYSIPGVFVIVSEGNDLVIDSTSGESIGLLEREVGNKNTVLIKEFFNLDTRPQFCNIGQESLNNEIFLFLKNQNYSKRGETSPRQTEKSGIQDLFFVGSEWFYFKIYASYSIIDDIVVETLPKCIEQLKKANCLRKWFFVRYNDGHEHLRVRISLMDLNRYHLVLSIIQRSFQPLLKNEIIWKFHIDNYRREIERYGASRIELTETLFWKNSELTTAILLKGRDLRIRLCSALFFVDTLFSYFAFDEHDKVKFTLRNKRMFHDELGIDLDTKRKLNADFKTYLRDFKGVFEPDDVLLLSINKMIGSFFEKNQETITTILMSFAKSPNQHSKDSFLSSIIHMAMNRLFLNNPRYNEMLTYDFLGQYYKYLHHTRL